MSTLRHDEQESEDHYDDRSEADDDVEKGITTMRDKKGNDKADSCATKGVEETNGEGSMVFKAVSWIVARHEKYGKFMSRVHKIIVAVRIAEKTKEQNERRSTKC